MPRSPADSAGGAHRSSCRVLGSASCRGRASATTTSTSPTLRPPASWSATRPRLRPSRPPSTRSRSCWPSPSNYRCCRPRRGRVAGRHHRVVESSSMARNVGFGRPGPHRHSGRDCCPGSRDDGGRGRSVPRGFAGAGRRAPGTRRDVDARRRRVAARACARHDRTVDQRRHVGADEARLVPRQLRQGCVGRPGRTARRADHGATSPVPGST